MKKNTLVTVVIAGCMFATPLFASSFSKIMHVKQSLHSASNVPAKPSAKHEDKNYTDFSGSWAGKCYLPEGTDEPFVDIDFTIKHDDTNFDFDGQELKIGAVSTETSSDKHVVSFTHTTIEWNNDMSMLIEKHWSLEKLLPFFSHIESSPMFVVMGQNTFSLDDGKLIMNMEFKEFNEMEQRGDVNKITCTLNKTEQ